MAVQIAFDPTITLGTIGSTLVFVIGAAVSIWKIGVYIGKVQSHIERAEKFFIESTLDRKKIREEMEHQDKVADERHQENIGRFGRLFRKLFIHDDGIQ